jgi:radical SAM protein with 4Fe4S-binding SPASM domain
VKVRPEAFGAWVRIDDGTLVAVDRWLAHRLGVDGAALWDDTMPLPEPWPLEVHVAVTSRCSVGCEGCYQSATRDGEDVPAAVLAERLDALAARGVFTVAFGGGEPLLREDLGELARMARARGMVPVVTTSGLGMTREKAEALRDFAQVNVSHDGVGDGYATVRGFAGASMADRAVRLLVEAGVSVGINHVLTRHNVGELPAMVAHARALGVRELQLLRYKPAGRAARPEYLARRLTREQVASLGPTLRDLCIRHEGALSLRIDCALVPLLSGVFDDPQGLARFGVFGCEAGRYLGALRQDGRVAGCSFGVGVGTHGGLETWHEDEALSALRRYASALPEPCASCPLRTVCRGGCRVVSEHLTGAWTPDPECPRVIAACQAQSA